MSATLKHIPTTSSDTLDAYLTRPKEGSNLPRVLYEAGQHCRPATAAAEFRALRAMHGRQGETRRNPGRYVEPADPAEATHLKVGKNWRAARASETATHQRIEPEVPLTKRPEAFHFIFSFDLATVNPRDPEACQRAFEAVQTHIAEEYSGIQAKLVAHGDATGSRAAIERGEAGKFHVHSALNAVVHSRMERDGRTFEPGQRMAGALTHVDTMRERWDDFLARRGHEFGLGPQDRTVLPEVGSEAYRATRHTNLDHWQRQHGKISDHDKAQRGMETAYAELARDPSAMVGLSHTERLDRLAAAVQSTGDLELKLRSRKDGSKQIRSFVVPARPQPIASTKLGDRYTNAGVEEQLERIAQGQWVPLERGTVGPPKQIAEASASQLEHLQREVDTVAERERRDVELDQWVHQHALDEGISVDELWARQSGDRRDRRSPVARQQMRTAMRDERQRQAEQRAREAAEQRAREAEQRAREAEQQRQAEQQAREAAETHGAEQQPHQQTAAPRKTRPRGELPLRVSSRRTEPSIGGGTRASYQELSDAELLAVVRKERADGGAYVDFQLSAADPAARGQVGLHLMAERTAVQAPDGRTVHRTRVAQQLTAQQYEHLRATAGDNTVRVDGCEVMALRGHVMPHAAGRGSTVNLNRIAASQQPAVGPDVLDRQHATEDRQRRREQRQRETSASDRFTQASQRARERDRDSGLGLG